MTLYGRSHDEAFAAQADPREIRSRAVPTEGRPPDPASLSDAGTGLGQRWRAQGAGDAARRLACLGGLRPAGAVQSAAGWQPPSVPVHAVGPSSI